MAQNYSKTCAIYPDFFEILHAQDPKNIFTEHLKIGVDGASVT